MTGFCWSGPLNPKPAIQARASHVPHAKQIHFLPAAPPEDLLPLNASADVHAMPVQASTLNHRLNTPTKLFDAMGAGTPVVVSDLPGMAEIVNRARFGVLCDPTSPADIARAIREILDAPPKRREALHASALKAARGEYSWDRQVARLLELYDRLG